MKSVVLNHRVEMATPLKSEIVEEEPVGAPEDTGAEAIADAGYGADEDSANPDAERPDSDGPDSDGPDSSGPNSSGKGGR